MILKCEWCGMVSEADDCGWRFAEAEDGVARGTRVLTCPSCGSSELFEVEESEDEMSVSKWAWHEECDSGKWVCVGDCDFCDHRDDEGEDEVERMAEYIIKEGDYNDEIMDELVRCRDCKYYQAQDPTRPTTCAIGLDDNYADDFCSRGERRNDEKD